jgi:hypothetical protein
MNERRREVLQMLAAGKITADEAEGLLVALEKEPSVAAGNSSPETPAKPKPKYLRVVVDAASGPEDGPGAKVNVRVPMQLLRAGVKLASLIPPQAQVHVNDALREQGIMQIDLSQLKPENLEELIDSLGEMTVDVQDKDARVAVFCE